MSSAVVKKELDSSWLLHPYIHPTPTAFNKFQMFCMLCVCSVFVDIIVYARQPVIFAKHFAPNFQKEQSLTCPPPPSKDPDEDVDNGDGDEGAPPHTVGQPADLL